jgi:hypothetical protein
LKRSYVLILFLFCIAASLSPLGRKEKAPVQEESSAIEEEQKGVLVQVSGRVRLVGNAPFTELVITGNEDEWYIAREEAPLLHEFQHQTVTVEGLETVAELRFANGVFAGLRRTLRDIKILEISSQNQ